MRYIYVVDDDDAVRASLSSLLGIRSDAAIQAFRSGDYFLEGAAQLRPGCVLLDVHMPGRNGIDVLEAIHGDVRFSTIILTGQGDVNLATRAMKAGAIDFIEKPYDAEVLHASIEFAFARLERDIRARQRIDGAKRQIDLLSARETDVLKGLVEGQSNKAIAIQHDISPRTVEAYRANLMGKLKVDSLSEALRIAFLAELIPLHAE